MGLTVITRSIPKGMPTEGMLDLNPTVARIRDFDAQWFKRHPGKKRYVRRRIDGEYFGAILEPAWVLVTQRNPGARYRQPVFKHISGLEDKTEVFDKWTGKLHQSVPVDWSAPD